MRFIEDFENEDQISDIYLCTKKQMATSKAGKSYENVTLRDKTGTIECKIWDPMSNGIDEFEVNDFVDVVGDVSVYNGKLQLTIRRLRLAKEGEYTPENYFSVSEKSISDMYRELTAILDTVQNEWLRKLIDKYFAEKRFEKIFSAASAAKSVHHAFVGGLLEHTLSVVKLCEFYCTLYPFLNHDLLLTAAAFHDVGKIRELSDFPENDYTDEGNLLGHIMIGAELVGFACRQIGAPAKLTRELQHCILAHHGQLEYGSPKRPAIAEALALHHADNTDAKMETMREAIASAKKNNKKNDWLGYNGFLESNIRLSGEW